MAFKNLDPEKILQQLLDHQVDFIVVGGMAGVLLGAPIQTFDLDIVYKRDPENIEKLLSALNAMNAVYAGFEEKGLRPKSDKLAGLGHHLLITDAGRLDVLAYVGDDEQFEDLEQQTEQVKVDELEFKIVKLDKLINLKNQTGRDKDKLAIQILRALADEQKS